MNAPLNAPVATSVKVAAKAPNYFAPFPVQVTPEIESRLATILASNSIRKQCIALAIKANGGYADSTLMALHPDANFGTLLADPTNARSVELLAAHPVIQEHAQKLAARRILNTNLARIADEAEQPDFSINAARDLIDLVSKLGARQLNGVEPERHIELLFGTVYIRTPLGNYSVNIDGADPVKVLLEVVERAGCTTLAEAVAVSQVLSNFYGMIVLPGF